MGNSKRWTVAFARAIIAALALFACLFCARARAEADGMLRIKLARLGSPSAIEMRADCDYYLADDPALRIPADTDFTVSASGGSLTLGVGGRERPLGPSAVLMRSEPGDAGIAFLSPALSNRFCGDLGLSASGDVITTVLRIYVEDYLYGAVGGEMAPSSGAEALKAQAVVARTYALAQKAARSGAAYDLADAGDGLSYRGYSASADYAAVPMAVDDTRGAVLYYDGSPAVCYFCESNGGQTESAANATGVDLPYSAVRDDPYDLNSAAVKKTATLRKDGADLAPALKSALLIDTAEQLAREGITGGAKLVSIDDAALEDPLYPAPSRLYGTLALTLIVTGDTAQGESRTVRVAARIPTYGGIEDWYGLSINDADNETVWLAETGAAFELTFRRSGSGLGMSQKGAQAMAKQGFACEEILDYYYPGTALRSLELADATRDAALPRATTAPAVSDPIATARLSQKSRLYESADEAARVQTTLPAGATVQVYAVQGDWAAVGSGELHGFLRAESLASFALAGASAAQVKNETIARVGESVEVLQLPVLTASALTRLNAGAAVRLNAYTDAWALITTASGVEGFIPRSALTLQAAADAAEEDEITVADDLYGLLTEKTGLYVNADDSIDPAQALDKDSYVQILAYNSAWAYVRTRDDATGYVKLSSLSPVRQPREEAQASVDGGEITVVRGAQYLYVTADALSLFESYSTDSPVLMTLKQGEKVRLGAYNGKWACVRADGQTGFALLSGLSEAAPEAEDAGDIEGGEVTVVKGRRYAVVVTDGAPLYPSWNAKDAPLALLKAGDKVRLGAYNAAWACVKVDGVKGFMRVEALELSGGNP